MLHPFISSQALRFGRLGGLTISVAAHTSIVAIVVVATGHAMAFSNAAVEHHVRGERLVFVEPTRLLESARGLAVHTAQRALARMKAPRWQVPDLSALSLAVEKSVAADVHPAPVEQELDYGALASQGIDLGTADMTKFAAGVLGRVLRPNAGDAYTQDVVERVVWPHRENPHPTYPPFLLQTHVEGNFLVRFVVDSTGRVDEKSISIPPTAHRQFAESVRAALRRSRFYPAELGGRLVRQLVEQRFVFRIGDPE